ncbi:hypothetical protein CCAX7_54640 [Capsulimonas corticalis]|uniref:Uncharacterized protein n=2 Tax=Capsulimonas corticalis TaxID=2219043 RepID=A0A402D5U1_9BACT|nr:hypothetical protein CCAX7_54640 [Capsulimonas corticalis]
MPFLLSERDVREHPDWPQWFPYKLAEPHQRQAMVNHGQTLRRLAERGGLGHRELYHILRDERFRHTGHPGAVSDEVAALYLQELIEGYEPSIEGHQP